MYPNVTQLYHPVSQLKDEATWGDQINTRVPCIAWIGGPQAYFVKPFEARYLANTVSGMCVGLVYQLYFTQQHSNLACGLCVLGLPCSL